MEGQFGGLQIRGSEWGSVLVVNNASHFVYPGLPLLCNGRKQYNFILTQISYLVSDNNPCRERKKII